MSVIVVGDGATRERIQQAIAALKLKLKHDRMPAHWEKRRDEVMDEIDVLVDQWLALPR